MNNTAEAQAEALPFIVREMRPTEVPFVAATWLRSYSDSPFAKPMDQTDYYDGQSKLVNELINRGVTLVAEHMHEKDLLLGFACGERTENVTCLHFAYTKNYARRNGVANALIESLLKRIGGKRIVCSHRKAPATEIMARRGYAFSPWPLFKFADRSRR